MDHRSGEDLIQKMNHSSCVACCSESGCVVGQCVWGQGLHKLQAPAYQPALDAQSPAGTPGLQSWP